ncbi:MAG: DUF5049 domain-containing protein [Lachnospiraceae bacterium]|nr:DUF5049 domain-containing protein [Lachnospiraceae bacterium]
MNNELIREQVLDIRDSARTNMFDLNTVQVIAFEKKFYELVCFIEENKREYVHLILTGEFFSDSDTEMKKQNLSFG